MATRDSLSTATDQFSYQDPLLADMQHLMARAKLPSYLHRLHRSVIDLRAGVTGQDDYSHGPALLQHLMETQGACWKLTQMSLDPSLPKADVHAQMKAFVALMRAGLSRCNLQSFTHGTLGLLGYNGRFDTQMVLRSHRASVDYMQLSMEQLAGLAEIGNTLFQQLRVLRAQRNSLAEPFMQAMRPSDISASQLGAFGAADPLQLSNFAGVVDDLVSVRNAEMQALSTALHRLSLDSWCSDEQYLRLHCRRDDDPCLPSVFLKMVVLVDAWNKPSTPRAPSLPSSSSHHASSQRHGSYGQAASLEVPGAHSTDQSAIDVMVNDFLVDDTPETSADLDDSFKPTPQKEAELACKRIGESSYQALPWSRSGT
ncbi:hypothetical protein WJX73_009965 [Symbiochloris irregularis]|uniref:Uncharacterized protein n=1 Tax=Symbiochloris irregularis TaxID=706552 RepID=A0AAW1PER8_9CHLO